MDNAVAVIFGGNLRKPALEAVFSGKRALDLVIEKAARFSGVRKTVLLLSGSPSAPVVDIHSEESLRVIKKENWTKKTLLEAIAEAAAGFEAVYFVWADTPFLDGELSAALADRHSRYGADYSFADGYPLGLAPELLAGGCAERLAALPFEDGAVGRDALFSVLQKDINAFDIEVEIAPFDLRSRRLTLAADSRRGLLVLSRLFAAGFSRAQDAERFVREKPEIFRTLPAFFPIQISSLCPQSCVICPYSTFRKRYASDNVAETCMPLDVFEKLLDKIAAFAGDAVIDLSLWGELSLHPQKTALIGAVLARPSLSLIVETAGVGWEKAALEEAAALLEQAAPRENSLLPALSWVVSLDAFDAERYKEARGAGFAEAVETAQALNALFPKNVYAQAVRIAGVEDDMERFYRHWKAAGVNVIIQKYDNFCGRLPSLRVGDLSPVERQPCWHLMRDMPILLDGTVPLCREFICMEETAAGGFLGNAFTDDLAEIWQKGNGAYLQHARAAGVYPAPAYPAPCTDCDEYYTFNI